MAQYDYDLAIIGGGSGGLTAAAGAAQFGARTLLIEKEEKLGGDCLHYGCVPSKTLIRSARVFHQMKNAPEFGLPQAALPGVDYRLIARRIQGVISKIQVHDSDERFCKLGARVVHGTPKFVDEHAVELDGKQVTSKNWIIATGSSPMVPPIAGLRETPHLTNMDIFSLDRLPPSMIVLGGGPIGVEMAQAFARLGSSVKVVEMADQILGPEDADMAAVVQQAMAEEGVEFYLSSKAMEVSEASGQKQLVIEQKDGQRLTLSADSILCALGRAPNVKGLGLSRIEVEHGPRGIVVDSRMRTSRKNIFAVGDCTGGYMFTHAAGYEGGIALTNAVLRLPRKANYTWMPWCTYTDPEMGSIGMNEKRAKAAGIDYRILTQDFENNDRALAQGEGRGRIKLVLDSSEKPIGVQVCGPGAGDIINQWAAVLNGKVKLSTLAGAIHPYPTLGEISKRVAGDLFAPKLYSDKVKKGLKLFFNLRGRACQAD